MSDHKTDNQNNINVKRRIIAVTATPYQLLVLLFIKDAFLGDAVIDLVITDKTPSMEELYKSGKLSPFFDNVLFADARKIDNPYKGALRTLWESFVFNKTTDEIVTGSLGTYDEFFFASPGVPDEVVKELAKTLIKKNRQLVFHRYEDGFASYTKPSDHVINTPSGQKMYRTFMGYDVTEKEKDIYLFCPEMAEESVTFEKTEIPRDKDRIERILSICRELFDTDIPAPDEDVIFLGQGTENGMFNPDTYQNMIKEIADISADASGQRRMVLKPHPRGKYDKLSYSDEEKRIPVYESNAPFELAMASGAFEDKTLVSFYSTACVSGKLLFDSRCRIVFIYPMSGDAFNEKNDYEHYFDTFAGLYENVFIAHDREELKSLLALDSQSK